MSDKYDLLRQRRELIRQRDLHADKVRVRYAEKIELINQQLRAVYESEKNKNPKGRALLLYTEDADSPVRTCKECSEPLILASLDNAKKANEIADILLREDGREGLSCKVGWAAVRRLKNTEYCCSGCFNKKGFHSVYCLSTTQIALRHEEIRMAADRIGALLASRQEMEAVQ